MPVYSIVTETTLLVEGKRISSFHSLTLQQSIHTTHEFRVIFEHDAIEELVTLFPDQLDSLHRKTFDLTVKGDASSPALGSKGLLRRPNYGSRTTATGGV